MRLTDRDVEWLKALADGSEVKELPGSTSVVKNRLALLRRRNGAKTTTQLVVMALKEGLLTWKR